MPSTPYLGHPDCSSRVCIIQVKQQVMTQNLEIQYRAEETQTWTSYPDSVRTWNHLNFTRICRDFQWDGEGYSNEVKTPRSVESKADMNVRSMCTEATVSDQVPQTSRNVTFHQVVWQHVPDWQESSFNNELKAQMSNFKSIKIKIKMKTVIFDQQGVWLSLGQVQSISSLEPSRWYHFRARSKFSSGLWSSWSTSVSGQTQEEGKNNRLREPAALLKEHTFVYFWTSWMKAPLIGTFCI